ncbi:MAG: sigma 54-interacting transcriptional regulator, partial [Proteobacteria bacterium]|nr:sigma 54-interacting transcriptional regulator [Pseudomonadota bacterium]
MSDQHVRWDEFDKMHVIRRLREVVGKWWKVQLNFTDQKGLLRGVPEGKFFNPLNPVCSAITSDAKGFEGCRGTVRQSTVSMTSFKGHKVTSCHAGFSAVAVPIRVNGQFVGTAFADGFIVEESAAAQKAAIKSYLERAFMGREKDLVAHIESLPVLSVREVEYLTELINLVVEEIVLTHKSLNDQEDTVKELSKQLTNRYSFGSMVGKSAAMQSMYKLLERVADSDATILIQGENGTGKELISKALHFNSKRKKNKFIAVNCGAFNDNLLESELFGHAKGSFTGAIKDKKGFFEEADGGTLFLDEIGETSMAMQVKLLRVLQDGTFNPVGANQTRKSNVRVLAATNRDLAKMVKEGTFREDLFYRLNVINVTVPALRNRSEDIKILSDHFLANYSKESKKPVKHLSTKCFEKMMNFPWPGNVRQLENEIERLCVLSGDDIEISDEFLSQPILDNGKKAGGNFNLTGKLRDAMEEVEKQMIVDGLNKH